MDFLNIFPKIPPKLSNPGEFAPKVAPSARRNDGLYSISSNHHEMPSELLQTHGPKDKAVAF